MISTRDRMPIYETFAIGYGKKISYRGCGRCSWLMNHFSAANQQTVLPAIPDTGPG
jgi:hypothetical protein